MEAAVSHLHDPRLRGEQAEYYALFARMCPFEARFGGDPVAVVARTSASEQNAVPCSSGLEGPACASTTSVQSAIAATE